jgi:hypothetical protein
MKIPSIDMIQSEAEARDFAIDWQAEFLNGQDEQLSYSELSEWQDYFTELASKFNLTAEFKENGVI